MNTRLKATLSLTGLTSELSQKVYAISKVHAWMELLNQNMKPTKFCKATRNGTKVHVEKIMNQQDYDEGLEELEAFAYLVNKKHQTDFTFKRASEVKNI